MTGKKHVSFPRNLLPSTGFKPQSRATGEVFVVDYLKPPPISPKSLCFLSDLSPPQQRAGVPNGYQIDRRDEISQGSFLCPSSWSFALSDRRALRNLSDLSRFSLRLCGTWGVWIWSQRFTRDLKNASRRSGCSLASSWRGARPRRRGSGSSRRAG